AAQSYMILKTPSILVISFRHSRLFKFFFHCYDPLPDLHSFPTRRSSDLVGRLLDGLDHAVEQVVLDRRFDLDLGQKIDDVLGARSEEHTSELQSLAYLVCRLLLEKKKVTSFS